MNEHILTIDLEDWFHCLEPDPGRWSRFARRAEIGTRTLLELLGAHDARATFFVLGDVAKSAPHLVREIVSAGHEVGSHGTEHRFIARQTPDEFRRDLRESMALLSDLSGAPVLSYRAPYFSVTRETLWALDILADEGIRNDSSIFPVRNSRYGIAEANRLPHEIQPGLMEWPISTLPSLFGNLPFSGGAYLRLLPLAFVRHAMRQLERRGEPVIAYLHPWELDPDQPRHFTGSRFLHFRHYFRLDDTKRRLATLLAGAKYASLPVAARSAS